MKYDSNQLSQEMKALQNNKELVFQQYHKISGAIDLLEAMHKKALEFEKEEQDKIAEEERSNLEHVPEHNQDAVMD